MQTCKAKLPDGKPCPNRVDERQQYCPFHLASQDAGLKKTMLTNLLNFAWALVSIRFAATIPKVAKILARKIR